MFRAPCLVLFWALLFIGWNHKFWNFFPWSAHFEFTWGHSSPICTLASTPQPRLGCLLSTLAAVDTIYWRSCGSCCAACQNQPSPSSSSISLTALPGCLSSTFASPPSTCLWPLTIWTPNRPYRVVRQTINSKNLTKQICIFSRCCWLFLNIWRCGQWREGCAIWLCRCPCRGRPCTSI